MAEGKRYYWLKLKDDFFESKRIKKLRRMAGGDTYTIIYLKMQLIAMKHDGIIKWTGLEDNIAEELALDLDEEEDNVAVTLSYLLHCGLAETSDNVNYFFPYSIENTGSEGASAQRVRDFRAREAEKMLQSNEIPLQSSDEVTQPKHFCNGEIEKEIEIDKDIDIEKSKSKNKEPTRHKYGEFKNVLLSDDEIEKLKNNCFGYLGYIDKLSMYIAKSGKTYKSHYATILSWSRKDAIDKFKDEELPF